MKNAAMLLLVWAFGAAPATQEAAKTQPATRPAASSAERFRPFNVFIDAGDRPLAAYQFELIPKTKEGSRVEIVGAGGGDGAFEAAPYYDTAALVKGRIIIAAYSTDTDLPAGRTRVAQVQLRITGPAEPEFTVKLIVAATADGKPIPPHQVRITLAEGETK